MIRDLGHDFVAIDPGKITGFASFCSGKLIECGIGKPYNPRIAGYFHYVMEKPVIYPHSKARPNDIITLALTAGLIAGRVSAGDFSPVIHWVEPRTWKGTIDGDTMTRRIVERMTDDDRAIFSKCAVPKYQEHNVVDAIGLGYYALGKF